MNSFRGVYTYSVDDKGRINIPAKFRKVMSPQANETFIVCRGPDNCLRAFPLDEWEHTEERMEHRLEQPQAVRTNRHMRSTLSESALDAQGRIALSPPQMQIAGIAKSVLLIGNRGYIELWDPERFQHYMGAQDDFNEVFYQSVESATRTPSPGQ